jgi:uncharacterized protein (DUF983 family)
MTVFSCEKCGHDLGAKQLKGKCKNCGASFKATTFSKALIYAAVFFGFISGQIISTPLMLQNGISPASVPGIFIGIMASISAVLIFAAIALKFLKYDWTGGAS